MARLGLQISQKAGGFSTDAQDSRTEQLSEIVRRIVKVADPEKIILFGSTDRGEMGPDSDFDLMVVKAGAHRRKLAQQIYLNLFGVGHPVDLIVVTPEDLEEHRDSIGLIVGPALEEGRVIYER